MDTGGTSALELMNVQELCSHFIVACLFHYFKM